MKVLSKIDDSPRKSTAWVNADDSTATSSIDSVGSGKIIPSETEREIHLTNNSKSQPTRMSKDLRQGKRELTVIGSKVETNARNATKTVEDCTTSRSSPDTSIDRIELRLELLSNWDHPRLVGLTELELLDLNNQKIEINPSTDVVCSVIANDIAVLFNGKAKVGWHFSVVAFLS